MNTATHTAYKSPPRTVRGTQTCIGAGTFIVSRQYIGNIPACDLLRQRMQQAAHTTSSIDEGIGTAV